MKVVAIDGALLNFGIAIGQYDPRTKRLTLYNIEHITHTRSNNNKILGDAAQIKHIATILRKHCKGADFVCAELPFGSKSAAAAWSLGIALGIIAALPVDIQWVTPIAVKKFTGNKTKQDMINWATKLYPHLPWPKDGKGRVLNRAEHCSDAVGVLHTALKLKG